MPHFVSEINIATVTLTENVGVIFCHRTEYTSSGLEILLTVRSIFSCFQSCKEFIQIVVPFGGANYI